MAKKTKKRKTRSDKGKRRNVGMSKKPGPKPGSKRKKKSTKKKATKKKAKKKANGRKKGATKAAKTRKSRSTFFKKAGLPGYKKPGRKKKTKGQIPISILERRLGELNTIVGERGGAAYSCD